MIRSSMFVVMAATLLWATSSAHALGISIVGVSSSGGNTALLLAGDTLTVDLRLENAGNLNVYGIGLAVRGYDSDADGLADNGLSFLGGVSTASAFNTGLDIAGDPVGGLVNDHAAPFQRGNPATPPVGAPAVGQPARELHAVLFEGISLSPSNGNGSFDPAVGGGLTSSPGGAHFRVQFVAAAVAGFTSAQQLTLIFGNVPAFGHVTIGASDGTVVPFDNASLTVSVIPEPGTALLLGLGLAGLAGARRR